MLIPAASGMPCGVRAGSALFQRRWCRCSAALSSMPVQPHKPTCLLTSPWQRSPPWFVCFVCCAGHRAEGHPALAAGGCGAAARCVLFFFEDFLKTEKLQLARDRSSGVIICSCCNAEAMSSCGSALFPSIPAAYRPGRAARHRDWGTPADQPGGAGAGGGAAVCARIPSDRPGIAAGGAGGQGSCGACGEVGCAHTHIRWHRPGKLGLSSYGNSPEGAGCMPTWFVQAV